MEEIELLKITFNENEVKARLVGEFKKYNNETFITYTESEILNKIIQKILRGVVNLELGEVPEWKKE